MFHKAGFTFIELLITLAVMAICFLPMMRMFSVGLEQVSLIEDLTTGRYLAQEEIEKVKNLGFTEAQLKDIGDVWEPAWDKPALDLNNKKWRALRRVIKGTAPLEVRAQVYPVTEKTTSAQLGKPVVELVTLVEDLDWSGGE